LSVSKMLKNIFVFKSYRNSHNAIVSQIYFNSKSKKYSGCLPKSRFWHRAIRTSPSTAAHPSASLQDCYAGAIIPGTICKNYSSSDSLVCSGELASSVSTISVTISFPFLLMYHSETPKKTPTAITANPRILTRAIPS